DKQMKSLVKTYVRWGRLSPYSLISLITIITKHRSHLAESDFIMGFLDEFMLRLEGTQENISRLCHVLNFNPRMMNNFLVLLSEQHLEKLIAIIDHPIWKPDIRKIQKNLITLCKLYKDCSYYFKRFLHRVFNSNAAYISLLNNQPKFAQIADGLLRNLDNFETLSIRIDKLGDYYDFEFLRLGIRLINGESFEKVNKYFTIFSDNYIQILFDLCRELVSREMEYHIPETKDLLAVFAAGGHARSQSFDDDYDLIILLNSEDEEMLQFANKIILKMNKHIIQRSIMTHYRFADRFKNYVTTFQNLKEFFKNPDENAFIDMSQLLGARMIVGSAYFKDVFEREIIEPYIFKNNQDFTQSVKQEIALRHDYHADSDTVDIKECPGGLRDLENFLFILKARFAIVDPISPKLFKLLSQRLADYREVLAELDKNYYFLKYVRDLYRLIVSDNDELQIKYLNDIIEPLNQSRRTQFKTADDLHDKIVEYMQKNVQNINRIFSEIIPH
ncbi:MAG: hypothetical protein KAT54_02010, partial [Candidatus Marinimicrobia bacterium]|nr:hypothetical protein [Candidatus Neomarinimicrobiota bacterium]